MNWGYGITLSFILFIALIATMVTISMKQDVNLVAEDYYQQEIVYQDQIERIRRTLALVHQPEINVNRQNASILIAVGQENMEEGQAVFFRPSDSSKDKVIFMKSAKDNIISIDGWEKGLWKLKLSWKAGGEEYYLEKIITL